jgi:hypothetical protein
MGSPAGKKRISKIFIPFPINSEIEINLGKILRSLRKI